MSVASTCAVSWLGPTTWVTSGAPFQSTCASAAKLLPCTVSWKAAPPTTVVVGARLAMTGAGAATRKGSALEVKLPGAGERVLTCTMRAPPTCPPSTVAVSSSPPPNSVARATPSHSTAVPLTKPLPVTVSTMVGAPSSAATGSSIVSTGCAPRAVVAQVLGWLKTERRGHA